MENRDVIGHLAEQFIAEPDMFYMAAKATLGYFSQLEEHLSKHGSVEDLTHLDGIANGKLFKKREMMENKLPNLSEANRTFLVDTYLLYIDLKKAQEHCWERYPDFEMDYSKLPP